MEEDTNQGKISLVTDNHQISNESEKPWYSVIAMPMKDTTSVITSDTHSLDAQDLDNIEACSSPVGNLDGLTLLSSNSLNNISLLSPVVKSRNTTSLALSESSPPASPGSPKSLRNKSKLPIACPPLVCILFFSYLFCILI
jgi:hypothetical protein